MLRRCLVGWVVLAACGESDRLTVNTFAVPETETPVVEVACPGTETTSPWRAESSPVQQGLGGIWGSAADDIWAVGGRGTILHWDGQFWEDQTPGLVAWNLLGVHGRAADDVWAVGRGGTALRWDGRSWVVVPTPTERDLVAVRVLAADDVWMVGAAGIFRYDGEAVVAAANAPVENINGMWASGPSDVWFVGDTAIHRYDGARFSTQEIDGASRFASIWGTGPGRAWAIGHGTGNRPGFGTLVPEGWRFESAPPRDVFFRGWTEDGQEILVSASNTSVFRYADGAWCREHIGGIGALNGFFRSGAGPLWAVGAERVGQETRPLILRRAR